MPTKLEKTGMDKITSSNIIKLYNPSDINEFIAFYLEKSLLLNHCNIDIELQLNNGLINREKWTIHFSEIIKMANWYKNMLGYSGEYPDLIIEDLNLELSNYFFEKGDGVYSLTYTSELGKVFKFQFWEQVGNSNMFIYKQFMECLERCK
ncbi:MAG: hypothetical protein IPJ32_21210 [Sphingobacteriaceae bacterium]|nr:hypothetical protein [Sphingobacteriaceae bacterium]